MPSLLNNLTSFADQVTVLQLPDGSTANMELIYQGATERWVMNISYDSFTADGIGVCCYPNLLRPWEKILPFGIACVSANQTDPFTVSDFSSGRVSLYLLTKADVSEIETTVFGGASLL